jgi:tetratricopeptide (TPR) repeat protein
MKFYQSFCRFNFLAAFLLTLTVFALVAEAQNKPDAPKVSDNEAKLARKLQDSKDLAEKMKLAAEFVKKYPNSPIRAQVAQYIAAQIDGVQDANQKLALAENYLKIFQNPGESEQIAISQIDAFVKLKRHDEAFKIGGEHINRQPDDVQVRLLLAVEGANLARAGEGKFAAPSRDYAVKAAELIEAGKKPADIADEGWREYQTKWLPQLYQSLGFLDAANGSRSEALANFEKAAKLAPGDVNNWAMMGFINDQLYQATASRFNIASGAEQAELRKKAESEMDKVIEYYARVVAMTEGDAANQKLNQQIRQDLETYYKYRNKNSTAGLQELINKYKTPKPSN